MIQINFTVVCWDIYYFKVEVDKHMLVSEFMNNLDRYIDDKEIALFIRDNMVDGNRFREGLFFSIGNERLYNLDKPFKDCDYNDEEDRAWLCLREEYRNRRLIMDRESWTLEMHRCEGCGYLIEGDNGEWICDDCGKEIHSIPDDECSAEQEW